MDNSLNDSVNEKAEFIPASSSAKENEHHKGTAYYRKALPLSDGSFNIPVSIQDCCGSYSDDDTTDTQTSNPCPCCGNTAQYSQQSKVKCYPITKIALKCGCPSTVSIPLDTLLGATFTITNLAVDASKFKNPCIELSFAANFVTTAAIVSASFQIFKQCQNQFSKIPVGGAFTYTPSLIAITQADTITFNACDCDGCFDECCNYMVIATMGLVTVGVSTINNAVLSAVITDKASTALLK